jgi:hypothetical protein
MANSASCDWPCGDCVGFDMNSVGKPDARNRHVRLMSGDGKRGAASATRNRAHPRLYSVLCFQQKECRSNAGMLGHGIGALHVKSPPPRASASFFSLGSRSASLRKLLKLKVQRALPLSSVPPGTK